jgi:hypothetical protein
VKKFLASFYILATIVVMEIAFPQHIRAGDIGNNFISPAVTFGDGKSTFGVNGKIGITDNFSLRQFQIQKQP